MAVWYGKVLVNGMWTKWMYASVPPLKEKRYYLPFLLSFFLPVRMSMWWQNLEHVNWTTQRKPCVKNGRVTRCKKGGLDLCGATIQALGYYAYVCMWNRNQDLSYLSHYYFPGFIKMAETSVLTNADCTEAIKQGWIQRFCGEWIMNMFWNM